MPLYDYQCEQCRRHTEKIQKFSDAPLTECPHCGGRLERVLHAPAVAFKGGGWYADGYGNSKPKSEGKSSESKSDSSAAKTSSDKPSSSPAPSASNSGGSATAPSAPPATPASSSSSSDKK